MPNAFQLVRDNDFNALKRLLESRTVDVNARGLERASLLHLAVEKNNLAITELLLAHGADIEIKSFFMGQTPLHYAAIRGCTVIAKLLLSNGACIDVCDEVGDTPLCLTSVMAYDEELLGLLLLSGANAERALRILVRSYQKPGAIKRIISAPEFFGCVGINFNEALFREFLQHPNFFINKMFVGCEFPADFEPPAGMLLFASEEALLAEIQNPNSRLSLEQKIQGLAVLDFHSAAMKEEPNPRKLDGGEVLSLKDLILLNLAKSKDCSAIARQLTLELICRNIPEAANALKSGEPTNLPPELVNEFLLFSPRRVAEEEAKRVFELREPVLKP